MKKIEIYQVDAFTEELFGGNPAAVCPIEEWPEDELMQKIAAENNLSETAFIVSIGEQFEIRWFTPHVEIDLCGHATLASAWVVFNKLGFAGKKVVFQSKFSGQLSVEKKDDLLILDFPSDQAGEVELLPEIEAALGHAPVKLLRGKSKLMAILDSEEKVKNLQPDFNELAKVDSGGLIVTAPGDDVDFVSRFFVPQFGINEDPVTGSAHTLLIPYWSNKLGKEKMTAKQLSKRGGTLFCENAGERVKIGGNAILYLEGEIVV